MNSLKYGKPLGSLGILPEIMKVACAGDLTHLLDSVYSVWKEKSVPKDWANAVLVPIPKRGNLTSCDNWRGIALLDMVGKVVASII